MALLTAFDFLVPEQVIKVPRFRRHPAALARYFSSRRRRDSWWKRRRSCLSFRLSGSLSSRPFGWRSSWFPRTGFFFYCGPRRGLHGLHPGQSSAATAKQIVDNPVLRGVPRDFHQDPLSAAGSSDLPDTANQGVFRTSHHQKKVGRSRAPRGPGCGLQLMASMSLGGLGCRLTSALSAARTSWGTTWGCFFMVLVASVVLASAYSFWSTLYPEIMAALERLGRALVMRQPTDAL